MRNPRLTSCAVQSASARRRLYSASRPGFTFTEILFAVMILGIGFIMIAAIFPVAISQSQANLEDNAGVAVANGAANLLRQNLFDFQELDLSAPTPKNGNKKRADGTTRGNVRVFPFEERKFTSAPIIKLYRKLVGHLINESDPRFGWVPLGYRLGLRDSFDNKSAYCEFYIVAVASRLKPTFDARDLDILDPKTGSKKQQRYTFHPKEVFFTLKEGGPGNPDLITFTGGTSAPAAEGAYVVVADDQNEDDGSSNGRMYRLGAKRDDIGPDVWELQPGNDMVVNPGRDGRAGTSDDEDESLPRAGVNKPAKGLMVGRGYSNPDDPNSLEGPAMDLYATRVVVFFK